ncbi:MAG: winged helix-turn-helix domain-containing protein [Verrucomicrobia bacterium]|nr:winged helix-turn-helix domain-containing protein [Verrucomicrobiota bacterium]
MAATPVASCRCTTRTLDQVIAQLRRKLGDRAEEPRHLLTVHGVGYRLKL